ncbi:MAG: NAD-dependent DNA ligase LigA, partial [Alphaproteobacteria bacterium]|nr:NAD-dependent DNA ligase LigA [Alphaproteobacteria bacterium]
ILNFMRDETKINLIKDLTSIITIENPETIEIDKTNPLFEKTIVFTGTLSSIGRKEAEDMARKFGAHPTSSVSKKTNIVVAGESAGSKLDTAQKLGITIMSEQEFLDMTSKK